MQPHHKHDCHRCQLLGAIAGPKGPVDLYVCADGDRKQGPTYIARYSSDGPDYSSGSRHFLDMLPAGASAHLHVARLIHDSGAA